jgi:hypothetical protein
MRRSPARAGSSSRSASADRVGGGIVADHRHVRVARAGLGIERADELEVPSVGVHHPQGHRVEVEDRAQRLADPLEQLADPQAPAQDGCQGRDRAQSPAPVALAVQVHDVVDERPDDVGDLPARLDVVARVALGRAAADDQRADDPAAGVERCADARADAGVEQPGARGRSLGPPPIGPHVGDEEIGADEHRVQIPLGGRVVPGGIEVRRVAAGVKGGAWPGVLREHREGARITRAVGDQQPVVRDEPLRARRELEEKMAGIELPLQRPRERGHAGEQIGHRHVPEGSGPRRRRRVGRSRRGDLRGAHARSTTADMRHGAGTTRVRTVAALPSSTRPRPRTRSPSRRAATAASPSARAGNASIVAFRSSTRSRAANSMKKYSFAFNQLMRVPPGGFDS